MKNTIFGFIIILFLTSCTGNKTSKIEKLNIPEMAVVDSITKAEKQKKADSLRKLNHNRSIFKSAKPLTEEQKKKNFNLRKAHTAFKIALDAYNKGDIETATEKFRTCLSFNPDNAIADYNLGKIYYDQKQPDLALSYFKDAINSNKKDTASMVAAGLIYFEKNDFNKAKKLYDEAINIAPHYGKAYFHRGTLYGTHKYYRKSKQDLLKAIKYDPENSEAYVNLGLAYFYLKDMQNACKAWHKAAGMGNAKGEKAVQAYCNKK